MRAVVPLLFLAPDRVYGSYQELVAREAALPADQRIDFVSIVVRNDLHVAVAKAFLAAGINVVCEKPMSFSLAEGKELKEIKTIEFPSPLLSSVVAANGCLYITTHTHLYCFKEGAKAAAGAE